MPEHTVAIVHTDPETRKSLTKLLRSGGFKPKPFETGKTFLEDYEQGEASCVISGLRLPDMDGLELQSKLAKHKVRLPMIMLASHGDVPLAVRAMKAGAVDFIQDPFQDEHMLSSIKECVHQGVDEQHRAVRQHKIAPGLASLTSREREVLDHLLCGDPNKVVAYDLHISPRTLEIHRSRLMEKMHARSLADLVRMALSAGLGDVGHEAA